MNKKYLIIGLVLIFGTFAVILLNRFSVKSQDSNLSAVKNLIPAQEITHGHGLAVDNMDPTKLYIATHHGLFLLKDDKDLFSVGGNKDDYMGFSPHPDSANTFFSSGHPEAGGNLGLQKSEDGGFTWKNISDVENAPVDFHAMAVSPANPDLIYGSYQGNLYKSNDGGKDWDKFPTKFLITSIVADPTDEKIVYALTPQGQGILMSRDQGKNWEELSTEVSGGIVSSLAINPNDNKQMLTFSEKLGGLGASNDKGITWNKIDEKFNGEEVLFLAFSKPNPNTVYSLTHLNSIYKSIDKGLNWKKIR